VNLDYFGARTESIGVGSFYWAGCWTVHYQPDIFLDRMRVSLV